MEAIINIDLTFHLIELYIFFREFQLMTSTSDDSSLIGGLGSRI